ncbi:hypothetical protein TIFTF001_043609 [Ficus carica]|uniref:Uncharacterized protein n=1 Tax=Ficus carica TaxID=3494 RepID=A0AA87YVF3_FICCA|nr:hypothetical protein TIFTF001_043609 [Ficus carica]
MCSAMSLVVGTWSAYWAADSFRRSIPSCHVSLVYRAFVPRGTPPRAGRQSGTLNFEISNFELELEVGGKSNHRLDNRARISRSTLAYK